MKIFVYENGPFLVNTYLVINKKNNKAFIIDPGSNIDSLYDKIEKENLILEAVVNTHGHIDHVSGVSEVKKRFNVPFYMNDQDAPLLKSLPEQAEMFGISDPDVPSIDINLSLSGEIKIADLNLNLLYTPGHSKGSISIQIKDVVFSGDALFNLSIGRTDLPGGDYNLLITSIREKLLTLPEETTVFPGHGPKTTIGKEKLSNPFLT